MTRCPSQDWDHYCAQQEGPDITELSVTRPRARREYPCDCCREPIKAGERYQKHVYIDHDNGSKLVSMKMHGVCPWELAEAHSEY